MPGLAELRERAARPRGRRGDRALRGRSAAEHLGGLGDVDIITATLGKALGGAAGGFVAASAAVCDYLTQRARPQLLSNALPPTVAVSALASIEYLERHPERVKNLRE